MLRYLPLAALAGLLAAIPAAGQHVTTTCAPVQVQKVVTSNVAVAAPLVVAVPVDVQSLGNAYYYSVGEAYRDKAMLREVIREELKALGGQPAQVQAQAVRAPKPAADPGAAPQPIVAAAEDVPDDATPQDLQDKVLAAYNESGCVSCHSGPGASKGFRLVDDGGRLLKKTADKRWKLYGMASSGVMPPAAANDASKAMKSTHLPALLQYAARKD